MADVVVERNGGFWELLLGGLLVYLYFYFKQNSCSNSTTSNGSSSGATAGQSGAVASSSGCVTQEVINSSPQPFFPSMPLTDVNAQSGRYIAIGPIGI